MATSLRDDLRQARAFTSLEQEAHLNIVRTALVLGAALEDRLRPAGLSVAQFNVLRILRGAGAEGLCRYEVAERLLNRTPDVTRLLDRMVRDGLVIRARADDDRRQVRTAITPKGLRLLARVDGEVEAEHRRALGHLGARDLQQLVTLLTRARHPA
ncbi:MAG: MarR family transcriptional regulator [Gemmatimonadetes bacterium]|nr:MarR family transcriptional regulator [Gemmatimonadota bacterium]